MSRDAPLGHPTRVPRLPSPTVTPPVPGAEPIRSPDLLDAPAPVAAPRPAQPRPPSAAPPVAAAADAPGATPSRRFWTVVSSHAAVDLYAAVVPALSLALAASLHLSKPQLTALFVINSVMSGVSQPVFAWLTDRLDTRLCAPIGLAISALCLSLIGYADSYAQLIALQVVGQIGVGMFHPIGAALAGQIGRGLSFGRSMAVTLFFTAGMLGSVLGPVLVTRMNERFGMTSLAWLIPFGLIFALVLHRGTRGVAHRQPRHASAEPIAPEKLRACASAVRLLFAAAVLRFGVNNALFFLFSQWCDQRIPDDAAKASSATGGVFAVASIGMGVASLVAGRTVRPGSEKGPMVVLPLVASPLVAAMGFVDPGASWTMPLMMGLAFITASGYAATAPLAITLAQRLMPGKTGVASSLMMGGAWTVSSGFPFLALFAISLGNGKAHAGAPAPASGDHVSLLAGFVLMAVLLALNGVMSMMLPSKLLKETAEH